MITLTRSASRTSSVAVDARPPPERMRSAAGSMCSGFRLARTTCMPRDASSSATPKPIPVPPPVMTPTCPANSPSRKTEPSATDRTRHDDRLVRLQLESGDRPRLPAHIAHHGFDRDIHDDLRRCAEFERKLPDAVSYTHLRAHETPEHLV